MGPGWAPVGPQLGPKWAPDGPDWGPFGNAAWDEDNIYISETLYGIGLHNGYYHLIECVRSPYLGTIEPDYQFNQMSRSLECLFKGHRPGHLLDPTDFDSICGISPGFPGIPSRFPQTVSKYPNLKCLLNITIYQSGMISSVFEREFQWL